MKNDKDFNRFRAEKLAYVFFSRLDNLLIEESQRPDALLDFMVDILENGEQTGRYFGVEIRATEVEPVHPERLGLDFRKYENVNFPVLLAIINTRKDVGYLIWIKKPTRGGKLKFISDLDATQIEPASRENLQRVVSQIEEWYQLKTELV